MPQPGVHAVFALATRKTFSTKRWIAPGLVFGALLPDADGYAQAYAILVIGMNPHLADKIYHRTLTHSLFFALGLALVLYLISFVRGGESLRNFGLGLAIGMAILHSLPDIFMWFRGIGLLWPIWSVNLWSGIILPDITNKLLGAANFWAFAWYFAYLASLARKAGTNTDYLPRLRRYTYIQIVVGLMFTVLAFVLPTETYTTLDGAAFLVLAYPNALWISWRMSQTIEAA